MKNIIGLALCGFLGFGGNLWAGRAIEPADPQSPPASGGSIAGIMGGKKAADPPSTAKVSDLPCGQEDFQKFLPCFTGLDLAGQLRHLHFPVQVVILDIDEDRSLKAEADFFRDYSRILASASEYEKADMILTVKEIDQNTMTVVTGLNCSECSPQWEDHVFIRTDQGWRMVSMTIDDTGL